MSKNPHSLEVARKLAAGYELEQLRRDMEELRERECEALRLYEPLPYQERFHAETAQQCLIQKGNRTGASLALMVEIARAVTGTDPHGKYPKRDGKAVILVYGENHVGRVVYNGLFRPGHFKGFRLIRDLKTKAWRTYRPWPQAEGGDLERVIESMPHGPLIPKRYIDGKIAWLKRVERVFSLIRFNTGWELYAANSAGDPGQFQGISINLFGIDEDMARTGWYEEAPGRLIDVGGKLRWTALPHAKNDDMMQLISFAEKEAIEAPLQKRKASCVIHRASIFDNQYIEKSVRDETLASWQSMGEDIYRKRAYGDLSVSSSLMYPTFHRKTHDVLTYAQDGDQRLLASREGVPPKEWTAPRILAARLGEPPDDWTRYVSIDPGYQFCGIAFLTIPPPALGDFVFLYDLCYLAENTSTTFGDAMQEKCSDNVYEQFIFDMHGGKLRSISEADVPVDKYREALEKRRVVCNATGSGFTAGNSDRKYREEVMRTFLAVQRNAMPRFMFAGGKCISFVQEMEKFRKKSIKHRGKDIYTDEGDRRAGTHAIEAVEQALSLELQYVEPKRTVVDHDWLENARTWGQRQRDRVEKGRAVFAGPGTISLGPLGVN